MCSIQDFYDDTDISEFTELSFCAPSRSQHQGLQNLQQCARCKLLYDQHSQDPVYQRVLADMHCLLDESHTVTITDLDVRRHLCEHRCDCHAMSASHILGHGDCATSLYNRGMSKMNFADLAFCKVYALNQFRADADHHYLVLWEDGVVTQTSSIRNFEFFSESMVLKKKNGKWVAARLTKALHAEETQWFEKACKRFEHCSYALTPKSWYEIIPYQRILKVQNCTKTQWFKKPVFWAEFYEVWLKSNKTMNIFEYSDPFADDQ